MQATSKNWNGIYTFILNDFQNILEWLDFSSLIEFSHVISLLIIAHEANILKVNTIVNQIEKKILHDWETADWFRKSSQ
jgi:hypothetical protein